MVHLDFNRQSGAIFPLNRVLTKTLRSLSYKRFSAVLLSPIYPAMVRAPTDTSNPFSSQPHIGSLASYTHYDSTVHIGTHFPEGQNSLRLSQILTSENSDALIKDLATLVSHRGVVFFSNQDDLTVAQQKELGRRLGRLSETGGKRPETSGLHRHPVSEDTPELGGDVSVISSKE